MLGSLGCVMDRASTNQGSGGSKCVCIPRDCNFHGGNDDGFDSWNWGALLRRVLGVKKIQPKLPNRSVFQARGAKLATANLWLTWSLDVAMRASWRNLISCREASWKIGLADGKQPRGWTSPSILSRYWIVAEVISNICWCLFWFARVTRMRAGTWVKQPAQPKITLVCKHDIARLSIR